MEGHVVNVFDLNTVPRAHLLCSVPCPSGVQRFHASDFFSASKMLFTAPAPSVFAAPARNAGATDVQL